MLAASEAYNAMAPKVDSTLAAEAIEASTSLSISFCARATPIESAPPVVPAAPTASDAAPAFALITDASCALSVIASALIAAAREARARGIGLGRAGDGIGRLGAATRERDAGLLRGGDRHRRGEREAVDACVLRGVQRERIVRRYVGIADVSRHRIADRVL